MKKLKNLISFFIAVTMLISLTSISGTASAVDDPAIEAEAALLVELESGEILYSVNADEVCTPASTTKIMTLLLAVEAIERGDVTEDDIVHVSENVGDDLSDDATNVELTAGEEMSLLDMLYCAALYSANDACNAIAEHISGSVENFVRLMNSRAEELGCTNTHFTNPHGLTDEDHYTTAYDLYLMLKEAYSHELFVKLTGTSTYTVPSTNNHIQRSLTTTNKLLSKDSEYYYQDVKCGKTGYTDAAGYCLAAVGSNDKLTLISVIMGAEYGNSENGKKIYKHYSETRRLLEWGFDNFSFRPIIDTSSLIADVPVLMGEGTDSVVLCPEKSITMLVENDVTTDDEIEYDITIYSEENDEDLIAPINSGDVLGEVEVFYKGESQGTVKLIANSTVPLLRTEYLKSEFGKGMSSGWIKGTIFFIILVVGLYVGYLIHYNKRKKKGPRPASGPENAIPQASPVNTAEKAREKAMSGKNSDRRQ